MANDDSLEVAFEEATQFVRKRVNDLSKEDLLVFYAHFKYANEGACNVPRPGGLFNFEAKSKWDAWNALGTKLNKEQAMMAYIERLDLMYPQWQSHAATDGQRIDNIKERSSLGARVSMMANTFNEETASNSNDLFELVKQGNLDKLKKLIDKNQINKTDENGMTLLMWACDRGHVDLVKYLIAHGCLVNTQDNDGLSCLHYAVSCDRLQIVRILLEQTSQKVDFSLKDADGLTANEMANEEIKKLFENF